MTVVRETTAEDLPDVRNVVDGAALRVDVGDLRERIARGDVLVAVEDERVLGTLILDGDRVAAVAVRRARRDQGVGTALVEAAAERRERLVAAFDARVRPFWEAVGFDVAPAEEPGRYRGVLRTGPG